MRNAGLAALTEFVDRIELRRLRRQSALSAALVVFSISTEGARMTRSMPIVIGSLLLVLGAPAAAWAADSSETPAPDPECSCAVKMLETCETMRPRQEPLDLKVWYVLGGLAGLGLILWFLQELCQLRRAPGKMQEEFHLKVAEILLKDAELRLERLHREDSAISDKKHLATSDELVAALRQVDKGSAMLIKAIHDLAAALGLMKGAP